MGSGARANPRQAPQAGSVNVQLHRDAEEELYQAAAWYEKRRPGLGVGLLTEVEFIVEVLREFPSYGPHGPVLPNWSRRRLNGRTLG